MASMLRVLVFTAVMTMSNSHNTYLSGNQFTSESSVKPIIRALEKGVRGIELDLWQNSTNTDINVCHGYVLVSMQKSAMGDFRVAWEEFGIQIPECLVNSEFEIPDEPVEHYLAKSGFNVWMFNCRYLVSSLMFCVVACKHSINLYILCSHSVKQYCIRYTEVMHGTQQLVHM